MSASVLHIFLLLALSWLVSCTEPRQSGIEVGNPTLTVSAEFSVADGEPSYIPLSKATVAVANEEFHWTELSLPLSQVRYFASYYYYVPTDPNEGTQLWPTQGDTLLQMDVLHGDTLQANFENMDIPSRSYLKEVGLVLPMGAQVVKGEWCPMAGHCWPIEVVFPDSTQLDIRFHHTQMQKFGDSLGLRLPVSMHPKVFLAELELEADTSVVKPSNVIRKTATPTQVIAFARSFAGLRYFVKVGGTTFNGILPAALSGFDQSGQDRLINGDFSQGASHWIFLEQNGGNADTLFPGDSTALIHIKAGGSKDYSIQWMQEDVELIKDRWYRFEFTGWSDKASTLILSRLGRYYAPYDNLDDADEDFLSALTTTPTVYSYEFRVKESTPFGRLEFNLGGHGERKIYLRSVSVIQLEE